MCNAARFLHTSIFSFRSPEINFHKPCISVLNRQSFLFSFFFFFFFFLVFMGKHLQYVSTLRLQIAKCINVRCLVQNCNLSFIHSFTLSFFLSATLPIRLSYIDTVKNTSPFFFNPCFLNFRVHFKSFFFGLMHIKHVSVCIYTLS